MSDSPPLSNDPLRPPLAERAAAMVELRRGAPLVFAPQLAALAIDGIDSPSLRDFIALGMEGAEPTNLSLILTAERAKILNLPLESAGFARVNWAIDQTTTLDEVLAAVMGFSSPLFSPPVLPTAAAKFSAAESHSLAAMIPLLIQARLLPALLVVRRGCSTSQAWETLYHLPEAALRWNSHSEPNRTNSVKLVSRAQIPLHHDGMRESISAEFICFRPDSGGLEQVAVVIGQPDLSLAPLVRLHSSCMTGDLFGSMRCDCGEQLRSAIQRLAEAGGGVILYLQQEGRGIGIANKLRAYQLQARGVDTVDANFQLGLGADLRDYSLAAATLRGLGITAVRLLSNNPAKVAALTQLGITVVERIGHRFPANPHNRDYLNTKKNRSGHDLE